MHIIMPSLEDKIKLQMQKKFKKQYQITIPVDAVFHNLSSGLQCYSFFAEMRKKKYNAIYIKDDLSNIAKLNISMPKGLEDTAIMCTKNIYTLLLLEYDHIFDHAYSIQYDNSPHSIILNEIRNKNTRLN